jgi:arginine decarboxylase
MSGKMTLKERAEKESILGFKNYFCNFSVFQSLPDSWGIHQLFPIIPIHRLNEKPENKARIVDITCDSYGKIDNFVGKERDYIWLHDYPPGPYYLGIFLVGAYQEIMGGLHNLFGDTNVVHVELQDGKWKILQVIEGDTIEEVLRYAHYETDRLNETFRSWIEKSLSQGQITAEESAVLQKSFKRAMESYTYLTV